MNPADKRVMELLDKWLTSLELHLKYADLGDTAYAAVQPWPKHDRPTRWIIELARQKTLELKAHQESRVAMGDGKFAESLELMMFLANLVGSQHVQRFIPLAEPDKEQTILAAATKPPTDTINTRGPANGARAPDRTREPEADKADRTREMPPVQPGATTGKNGTPRATPKATRKVAAAAATANKAPTDPALQKKILADAVRLLKWGKEWHELADLIARIADRPSAGEIRRILRSHKAEIEMQADGDD